MKFFRTLTLLMAILMMTTPLSTHAADRLIASERMLSYRYSDTDLLFTPTIRDRAPEPSTQSEFAQLHDKAERGDADSNYLLYELYLLETTYNARYIPHGMPDQESEQRIKMALDFLERSLALNPRHPLALYCAGVNHEVGKIVEKNLPKAVQYFDLAAQNGNGVAAHRLFEIYMIGYEDIPKDVIKARYYAEMAKRLGSRFHENTTQHWDETLKYYERFNKVEQQ